LSGKLTNMEVIIAHDPLCGWCFGSAVETEKLADLLQTHGMLFEVRCGGLVIGERVRAVRHDADYLRAGLAQVEQVTGQRAGDRFLLGLLADGAYVSDSEPLCRLLWCIRSHGPRTILSVGAELSSAFYRLGLPPTDRDVLAHALQCQGIEADPVLLEWDSDAAREGVASWMAEARLFGVTTYPSVLVRKPATNGGPDTFEMVSSGFESAHLVFERLRHLAGAA
jgi:protein-disulfide isomerase-like protein with CxxC motif